MGLFCQLGDNTGLVMSVLCSHAGLYMADVCANLF